MKKKTRSPIPKNLNVEGWNWKKSILKKDKKTKQIVIKRIGIKFDIKINENQILRNEIEI